MHPKIKMCFLKRFDMSAIESYPVTLHKLGPTTSLGHLLKVPDLRDEKTRKLKFSCLPLQMAYNHAYGI